MIPMTCRMLMVLVFPVSADLIGQQGLNILFPIGLCFLLEAIARNFGDDNETQ